MALKERLKGKNPVVASLTIDFRKDGGQDIRLKGVENLTVGRLQNAFPDIFRKFHSAMHEVRVKQKQKFQKQRGQEMKESA